MRLIDADRLLKPSFTDMFDKPVKMDMFSRYAIESQPTVKAIPIEWLINKCNEADNMGMGIDDWSVKDCYQLVLEQWEKENEK